MAFVGREQSVRWPSGRTCKGCLGALCKGCHGSEQGFARVGLSFSYWVARSGIDGAFPATLSNARRLSALIVVNIQHTEARRGNARQLLRTSRNGELSVCA